jgi:hypothetical protein
MYANSRFQLNKTEDDRLKRQLGRMNTANIFKLIKHICTVPCSYVNSGFQLTKTEGGWLKGMEGGPGRYFAVANSKEKRSSCRRVP